MVAIDTNVLVRLITRDDEGQLAKASRFIADGAWVSHVCLAELSWVLSSVYDHSAAQISVALSMLLEHHEITLQDPETVAAAIVHFKLNPAIEFSDCLILAIARAAGYTPVGTFDKKLGKLTDTVKL